MCIAAGNSNKRHNMQNVGKLFEQDFQKSVPAYALLHRLNDSAQAFSGSGNLRFSKKNPFDYILWNPKSLTLYALELKTVKGKSISFERSKEEQKTIHYHQIIGLENYQKYDGLVCGFVIEFRQLERTIFIHITEFTKLMGVVNKKSFTIADLDNFGIKYNAIPQSLKKTHYHYDVETFLNETALHKTEV